MHSGQVSVPAYLSMSVNEVDIQSVGGSITSKPRATRLLGMVKYPWPLTMPASARTPKEVIKVILVMEVSEAGD